MHVVLSAVERVHDLFKIPNSMDVAFNADGLTVLRFRVVFKLRRLQSLIADDAETWLKGCASRPLKVVSYSGKNSKLTSNFCT
jgi:hypothetical protein